MSGHCPQGNRMVAMLTRAKADLAGVARHATRVGVSGERAQRLIPAAKAEVADKLEILAQHEAECFACAEVAA